jgi:hypothetical protein
MVSWAKPKGLLASSFDHPFPETRLTKLSSVTCVSPIGAAGKLIETQACSGRREAIWIRRPSDSRSINRSKPDWTYRYSPFFEENEGAFAQISGLTTRIVANWSSIALRTRDGWRRERQ